MYLLTKRCGIFAMALLASGISAATDVSWDFRSVKENAVQPVAGKSVIAVRGPYELNLNRNFPELSGMIFKSSARVLCSTPSSPETNLTDDFALEAIFKPFGVGSYSTICWKGNRNAKIQRIQYYLSIFKGRMEFKFKEENGEWCNFMTIDPVIQPNLWYRVVVRVEKGKASISVNGKECKTANPYLGRKPRTALVPNNDPLYVGTGHTGGMGIGYNFEGIIRTVRFVSPASAIKRNDPSYAKFFMQTNRALLFEFDSKSTENSAALKKNLGRMDKAAADKLKELEETVKSRKTAYVSSVKRSKTGHLAELLQYGKAVSNFTRDLRLALDRREYLDLVAKVSGKRDFALFTLPAGQGFKRSSNAFRLFESAKPMMLKAARGESEGFQLLPSASSKPCSLELSFSGFKTSDGVQLPKHSVVWGEIKDITAQKTMLGDTFDSTDNPEFIGSWPDMIVDNSPAKLNLPAERTVPVYFCVNVPVNARPGCYNGVFTLKNKSGVLSYPISVTVRSFAIPERGTLPVSFSFFKNFYKDYYRLKKISPEQEDYITQFLLSYRIPPCNIYTSELHPSIEMIKKHNLNFATAGYFSYKKLLTEDQLNKLVEKYRPRLEAVKKAGVGNGVYLYTFDEIVGMGEHEKTYPVARQIMSRFKKEFPWLKRLQTSQPEKELLDIFDVWVPLFSYFDDANLPAIRKMQARGVDFWWYPADLPYKPYPNFFLGYPLTDMRVISSMTYMLDLKGILYWCVNREWDTNKKVHDKFLTDPSVWNPAIINVFTHSEVNRNGMGNLMYPGPDGRIYPSLRLENFRDGLEDYEYYMLLKQKLAKLRKVKPSSPLIAKGEAALKVPASVATAVYSYDYNPQPLMLQHDHLGDLIESIDAALN